MSVLRNAPGVRRSSLQDTRCLYNGFFSSCFGSMAYFESALCVSIIVLAECGRVMKRISVGSNNQTQNSRNDVVKACQIRE